MSNDDLGHLLAFGTRVHGALERNLQRARLEVPASDRHGDVVRLLDAVAALTLRGGKRLRPYLAYHAALCVRPEAQLPGLLDACASLELLQSYFLIHDDIMDDDEVRRGGPAVHVMLGEGDRARGRALGILAGDLAATAARRMLADAVQDASRQAAAMRELASMEWDVIHGQFLDITGSPDVQVMHDLKTGAYTTRGPVRFGGVLAGADEATLETLVAYGTPLGLAFQLRDDLLDLTGDPAKTGKPRGTDIREGRTSAVIQEAQRRAGPDDLATIAAAWGVHDVSDEHLAAAVTAVERTGAIAACAERVGRLTSEAVTALDDAGLHDEGRGPLGHIARALASRLS
jgi:geranylgeranyl diphosphate synthase type I